MNYPLLTEYIEAIQESDNFDKLSDYIPVCDSVGKPIMSTGNFSVVFKMVDSKGLIHAVKCFTKEQDGRNESYREIAEELEYVTTNYLTSVKFYPNELFVSSRVTDDTEFPVVVMDWIEGLTLQESLERDLSTNHIYSLLLQFSKMSMWLISQPFSHGDIKPDNIIVRDDDTIVLVDYDGMYVPSMKGLPARESGTPDYRHPMRAKNSVYDEHIDDFSIAVIILSLMILYKDPSLYEQKGQKEGLLFSESDFYDIQSCLMYSSQKAKSNSLIWRRIFDVFETCLQNEKLTKEQAYMLRVPDIFDDDIIQGDKASSIISEIFWHISRSDYMIDVNLTDNILFFENSKFELKVEPHNGQLAISCDVNNTKVYSIYTINGLKKVLLSIDMWDNDIEAKLNYIVANMVLYLPELMIKTVEVFFENHFPDISKELTISTCGHTISVVSCNGLQTIREQKCIYFMLADSAFQKNCKRFGIEQIIAIDGMTGQQEKFQVHNLTQII